MSDVMPSQPADLSSQDWFRDPGLQKIMALLNDGEGEARIVGGAVRDALMDFPVGDIDIATTLTPEAVMTRAQSADIKVVPTGIDHGTLTLVLDGVPYEVTTLRADVATDGRHAEVAFGTDWQVDAERRDLTINALYVGRDGKVIDLVGGLDDVASRTVRFIGDPAQRITEDYLRILRFFRFFAWYGAGRPDADGLKAAVRLKSGLARLSAERVWAETKKMLAARDPSRALLWMRQSGVLTEILPESEKWGIDAIPALIHAEEAFGWQPDPLIRLMAMVPPDAGRMKTLAKRLKLSKAEALRLVRWAETAPIPHDIADLAFSRLLYGSEVGGVHDRLILALTSARARARSDTAALAEAGGYSRLIDRAAKWKRPQFPVSGADLLEAGFEQGAQLGALQKRLEAVWVAQNFTPTRAALLAMATSALAQHGDDAMSGPPDLQAD
jgi:poly(A) polymerase